MMHLIISANLATHYAQKMLPSFAAQWVLLPNLLPLMQYLHYYPLAMESISTNETTISAKHHFLILVMSNTNTCLKRHCI